MGRPDAFLFVRFSHAEVLLGILYFVSQATYEKTASIYVVDLLRLIGYTISKVFWFIRFTGRENIPPASTRGFLIAANHQTYIDPVWICIPMRRRFRFMAYDKAFDWKYIGPFIRYLGAFPVSLDGNRAVTAMKESIRALRNGSVLTVFPEGGREHADGKFFPFKTGAVRIAVRTGVPILPVTIRGGNRVWPYGQKYPSLFRRVEIVYHPLISVDEIEDNKVALDELTEKLRVVIESAV